MDRTRHIKDPSLAPVRGVPFRRGNCGIHAVARRYEPALPPTARQEKVALYTAPRAFTPPDSLAPHEPDFRRLLHWQSLVALPTRAQEIKVTNADELGTFEVIVEGVTGRGKRVFGRATYTVAVSESANAKE